MNTVILHKASLSDLEELQKISRQTFHETFADDNTEDNMQKYLSEGFSIGKLTTEITNPNSEFYLATSNNKTIGYLKINSGQSQTELKDSKAIEVERIYVLKEFHGKNVGQLLYNKALEIAHQKNVDYIWLGVWEKNPRAIRFYKKNGFMEFDKHVFILGEDEQTDILMKLEINNNLGGRLGKG